VSFFVVLYMSVLASNPLAYESTCYDVLFVFR
jgi:hypothetical protein